jgi:hypothetical protein
MTKPDEDVKVDALMRFVASIEVDLCPAQPDDSALRRKWRMDFKIAQRLALYDAAFEDDRPVSHEAFWRLICDAEEREEKSRIAMQEERRREQALRGER